MSEVPQSLLDELAAYEEEIILPCLVSGCSAPVRIRYRYLSDSGYYDLDCDAGHCRLYERPSHLAVIQPFYERLDALHNPIEHEEDDEDVDNGTHPANSVLHRV